MIPAKYWSPTKKLMVLGAMAGAGALVEDTVTGNPLTFITDKAKPLKRLSLSLLPRQSGTGDPSPSNIRPLLPWGEVGTWTGGKNLFDKDNVSQRLDETNFTQSGGVIEGSRTSMTVYIPCLPNTTYTISKAPTNRAVIGYVKSASRPAIGDSVFGAIDYRNKSEQAITTGEGATFLVAYLVNETYETELTKQAVINSVQIQFGNVASAFTPYTPITPHPVNLENITPPVYGCELDLTTGEVWGTYGSDDLGSLDYSEVSSAGVSAFRSNIGAVNVSDYKQHGITSVYPFAGTRFIANMPDKSWMIDAFGRLFVRDDSYSDTATLKTALIGQRIAYELATPVLLATLTPQQVNALVGVNTVWSDADGVEVTYLKKG